MNDTELGWGLRVGATQKHADTCNHRLMWNKSTKADPGWWNLFVADLHWSNCKLFNTKLYKDGIVYAVQVLEAGHVTTNFLTDEDDVEILGIMSPLNLFAFANDAKDVVLPDQQRARQFWLFILCWESMS